MRPLSLLPRTKLYALNAVVAVVGLTAGIAQATLRDGGPKPPARPLALAVMDAVRQAPKIDGVSAQIHFTNNLLPPGSLPAGAKSPLTAGADGHLWLARDGRFRLDLASPDGAAQIASDGHRVTVYDGRSQTQYAFALPAGAAKALGGGGAGGARGARGLPSAGLLQALGPLMNQVTISSAEPGTTAGRPSYTVRVAPKDDGGLLAAGELTWDAEKGMPLRAAIYAQDDDQPVLELAVTQIAYGPVTDDQLAAPAHPGAKTVDLDQAGQGRAARLSRRALRASGASAPTTGADAVQQHLAFPLAAPAELAGLPRGTIRLAGDGAQSGAVMTYGTGLGSIVVFERPNQSHEPLSGLPLPAVNIDGATGKELATALGTVVTFHRDGVSYLVAGLVPPVAAENAARGLR
jgi:outer membrane lipoprotein-sorting protein